MGDASFAPRGESQQGLILNHGGTPDKELEGTWCNDGQVDKTPLPSPLVKLN